MLVSVMVIAYQVCLLYKSFSKSCPHDQFVLNYGLSTKLYIASFSRTSSKSGNTNLTGLVRPIPDMFSQGFHQTSPVPLGINCFDHPLTAHLDSFLPHSPPTGAPSDSRAIWDSPHPFLAIPRGFHPLSSLDPVSTGFAPVQDIPHMFFTRSMIPSKL
jgi:hypothetical protein